MRHHNMMKKTTEEWLCEGRTSDCSLKSLSGSGCLFSKNCSYTFSSESDRLVDQIFDGFVIFISMEYILGLIMNSIILVCILKTRKLIVVPFYVIIAGLCVSESLGGLATPLRLVTNFAEDTPDRLLCIIYEGVFLLVVFLNSYNLLVISSERICALRFPMFYREKVTVRVVVSLMVVTWFIFCSVISTFMIFGLKEQFDMCGWEYMLREEVLFVINNFCIVTLTCSVILDIILIKELHQRTRKVTVGADNRKKEEQQAHLRRITSMMITVITVHCCLNLLWLITVNLPIKDEDIYFYIITPAVIISAAKNFCDPFIYLRYNRAIRTAVLGTLGIRTTDRQTTQIVVSPVEA